ncbi:GAF domain-containing sensor histidine kinase [Lysinibacillus endophyticus]|uniref:histidine kinase n=2 Tax=Ureibacillus endophyticus TaxID=1978490 RepID=A0A494YZH2_9BACL|nr:GAF domain-containing sensor histidine kinase [Lysinibacillus endophyticus]MCP1145892.1 GAF domain-containing sensor histidine kinase [Lysinibacillus endophyticus]RKQ15646.1 GAF domain-containing sensor histidine kinase [Lysinibacillus endophyticus]
MVMKDNSNITILKEIAELLNEETEMIPMLHGALSKFLNGTNFKTGWIFFINDKGKAELVAHENLPEALQYNECEHLKTGGCWCVSRYRNNELKKASNIIECQRIEAALEANVGDPAGITHHATVPLQSGDERFGILNVASANTVSFSDEELELLESVAFQMGSAIKRIYLTKQEQEIALVQERNRLARDLHDSVNQLLFSVTLTARAGIEMSEQQEIKETFKEIQQLTQSALTEMRALIWQLRPKGLESGLIEAIKAYAEMLNINLTVHVSGVIQFPSRIEETLFRIAQEALNNVRKHAGVQEAALYMNVTPTDILLVIKDEGRGFIIDNELNIPSIGLQSIKDRANAVGGTADIVSEIGKGTELLIRLPY